MFTLQTGSFRKLETAFVSDLLQLQKSNPLSSFLVLVPSERLRTHLQQCLAAQGSGFLNLHLLTLPALTHRLLIDAGYAERIVTEASLHHEIIHDLLEGRGNIPFESRPKLLREDSPVPDGLPAALAATLEDLRDAGALVVDCLRAALEGHMGKTAPEAEPALELYARVYQTLEQHKLRTPSDVIRRAADRAPTHPFIQRQQAIFLYGFYDFTGVQLDLALAMANHPDARLFFPYEDTPAFAYAKRTLDDPALRTKISAMERVGASALWARGRHGDVDLSSPERPSAHSAPAPKADVWSCSGRADEVWITAKKILELAEAGIPLDRILVTARSLSPYTDVVREQFAAHHIPYAMEATERVGAYPLVKTCRLALAVEDEGPSLAWAAHSEWAKERLKDLLVVRPLPSGEREGVRVQSSSALEPSPSLVPSVQLDLSPEGRGLQMESRLREAILETFDALSTLDVLDRPVSRAHFLDVWGDKMDRLTLALAPTRNAGVQVLDVMTARGLSFDVVFVLGMNEKSFPRLIREDPFLSDKARGTLAEALGFRLARKLDAYPEERMLFQLIVESAQKHLVLTYQRSDEEGKAMIPSLYLQDPAFPAAQHLPRQPVQKWRGTRADLLTPKELSVLLNRDRLDPSELYRTLGMDAPVYQSLTQSQDALESLKPILGPHDGSMGHLALLETIHKRGYSPDALKRLTDCPFRYFSGKILELKDDNPIAEEEGDLPKDLEGRIIHRILELHYRDQMPVDKACTKGFREMRAEAAELYPLVWKSTQIRILARISSFMANDSRELSESHFKPTFFEIEMDGVIPELGSILSAVRFHGRVDRVDIREEAGKTQFRIVDYKTGNPTSTTGKTETAVLKGHAPQLPIYMGMAGPWLSRELKRPVEAESAAFYNLADLEQGRSSPRLTPEFWQTHASLYADNLASWLDLVQKGTFFIRPSGERGPCSWCEFATICRKEHKPTAFRSEKSRERTRIEEKIVRKPE